MLKENAVTLCLRMLVGEGAGSGMAVMFLCTGILGILFRGVTVGQAYKVISSQRSFRLDLKNGFLLNELYREMDGHILDSFMLKGIYMN